MPIPFPKSVDSKFPHCSNCGADKVMFYQTETEHYTCLICVACKTEYRRVGDVAYRYDELQDMEDTADECAENDHTRHSVFGSLRQMADMFPDDNIVVLGDDLMTQLDAERLEGRITGHARGFRIGFVLGTIVTGIICGAFLLQAIKDMRGL